MSFQAFFQGDTERISQKRHQDMSLGPMLLLVINRTNAEIAFQASESSLNLNQLHVSLPQYCRVFRRQIRT